MSSKAIDTKLEVVIIPVADVERSKTFYGGLGWRLDADFKDGEHWRGVQMTPPGSPTSVLFGKNFTTAAPGSVQGNFLVVGDIDAARAELVARGIDASEVFHFEGGLRVGSKQGRVPGRDPQGRSYSSFLSFDDPDGNSWLLQEVTTRLPGRGESNLDLPTMTALLREAETAHGGYTTSAPKHHWSAFYAAYMVARQQGKSAEDAVKDGALNVQKSLPE
jgi:catechol 2,3-dioxygenase-like lactoylglutathione lyase family enzyme